MKRKKLLLIFITTFLLSIGIVIKILFFENIVYLWDMNDNETTFVHVGDSVIIIPPISTVYLSGDNILQPVSGLTKASSLPNVYKVIHKGKPTFRIVSEGSVDIAAHDASPSNLGIPILQMYHFKLIVKP